jgi:hypothetical protein
VEERPETAKNLTLEDFYRKEFIQALDVQTPVNSIYLPGTITFSHLAVKK